MVRFVSVCGRVCWLAVVLAIGLAGCAPLVDMEAPSPRGPRISHLRLVPSETRAGCPITAAFRFEAPTEEIASAKTGWVRRLGRSAEFGSSSLAVDVAAIRGQSKGEIVATLTPDRSGTYYYYMQVEDRGGQVSNVLRATLTVATWWMDPAPACPSREH